MVQRADKVVVADGVVGEMEEKCDDKIDCIFSRQRTTVVVLPPFVADD